MEIGDTVQWENGSYLISTGASGEIVAMHDTFVIVKRLDIAERYPHVCPFVTKRIWEVQVVAQRLAA